MRDLSSASWGSYCVTQNVTGETETASGENEVDGGRTLALAALGATVVALGLKRRSLVGTAMVLAGGWLLYRTLGNRDRRSGGPRAVAEAVDRGAELAESAAPTEVERTVTVGGSAADLSAYWRDPELLTQIVGGAVDVTSAGEGRTHWTAATPLGLNLEWDAELVEDSPGEVLRWESTAGLALFEEGSVRFRPAPADRGTEVTLALRFDPPGGALGRGALELLRASSALDAMANKALYRFKSLAETGEIPTLEGNPSGRGRGDVV